MLIGPPGTSLMTLEISGLGKDPVDTARSRYDSDKQGEPHLARCELVLHDHCESQHCLQRQLRLYRCANTLQAI